MMNADARIVWKLSVALMCAQGACVMKWLSGVRDDDEAGSIRNAMADDDLLCGFHSGRKDSGAYIAPMKGDNEERDGEVIDLQDYRNRVAVRDWARRNGFADLQVKS